MPTFTDPVLDEEIDYLLTRAEQFEVQVVPREPNEHDFRLASGGRLLQLIDRDWRASLKTPSAHGEGTLDFEMFLTKIDGTLAIIR